MSLSRQLILTLLCLTIVLVSSMFVLNLKHLQEMLSTQMEVQTQNSADSLALSLKSYMDKNDLQGAERIVDGFFNSGFYQKLLVTDPHKTTPIIERKRSNATHEVPEWFVELIPLQAPVKAAEVRFYDSGHLQRNMILLEAQSSHAYEQLWLEVNEWLILSVVLISAVSLLLVFLIRWQLSPLKGIEAQALAISRQDFVTNEQIPQARELGRVVLAMNSMSLKLKHFIDELTERAEQLLRDTRVDHLTGMMNRQSFMDNLHTVLNEEGVIAMIHVHGLSDVNDTHGYPAGNELLCAVAEIIHKEQELFADAFSGRISGADFALVTPSLNIEEFHTVFKQLESRLESLTVPESNEKLEIYFGVASYDKEQGMSKVLAKANHALSMAMHQERPVAYIGNDDHVPSSFASTDWGKLIDHVIEEGRLTLTSQDVVDSHGEMLFHCLLAKPALPDKEGIHTASFIAMAERLGRGDEFDHLVVSRVFQHASLSSAPELFAIKLLASSWYDIEFMEWFLGLLEQTPSLASRLFVTCTEVSLMRDIAVSKQNIDAIRKLGGRIIMDHFGSDLGSFSALRQLNPDFIKLDGSYIRDINNNDDHKMFIRIVTDIAHSLDIGVIAEHVETEAIKPVLQKMEIDAFQGHAISRIEMLEQN